MALFLCLYLNFSNSSKQLTASRISTGDEIKELALSIEMMADQLDSYDKSQKQFIQNITHELKTPLTSIQGYAVGIKDGAFDDGKGFSEEDLFNAFQRFYKGDYGDTGLGLTITKTIMNKIGGTLSISNRKGFGAEYIIKFKS